MNVTLDNDSKILIKPFLKWAGGKSNLLDHIIPYVPSDYMNGRYYEPFLGSGALFFYLRPRNAVLSDLSQHLINCYISICHNPKRVYSYLCRHKKRNSEAYYYEIRQFYNECNKSNPKSLIAQSARFMYLNKACFNGVFRVNVKGEFNVPYAYRKTLALPSLEQLRLISNLLKNTKLINASFEKVLTKAKRGDFVYLDPPYTVMHQNNGFIKYNSKLFSWEDQEKLCHLTDTLTKKSVKVLISNAAHHSIRKLYRNYDIIPIIRSSCISASNYSRIKVKEYLIKNY